MVVPTSVTQLFAPLAAVVPAASVELRGTWSRSVRRTYEKANETGVGVGPLVEVVDARWEGRFESALPMTGLAMRCEPGGALWVKAAPATVSLKVGVSLHARPGYVRGRASFTAGFHGAGLPSATIACTDDLTTSCTLGETHAVTGRPHLVAASNSVAFVVVLIPGSAVKVGRSRLWHLREEIRALLPADLRELLTRRRTGTLRVQA